MKRLPKPSKFTTPAFPRSIITGISSRKRVADESKLNALLLDSATDSIYLRDLDGNILYANKMAYASRGYSKEEFLRMNIHQITTSEHANLIKMRERETLEKGRNLFESAHIHKDGTITPVEVNTQLIELAGKNFILATSRDITERQQAEIKLHDAETLYRSLFEQSPDSMMIIDPETTKIIESNDAACKMFGYSREEFAGLKIADFDFQETPELIEKRLAQIKLFGYAEFTTKHRTKQGEIKDIMLISKPIDIAGKSFHLSIQRDITESKRLENELKLRAQLLDNATDFIFLTDQNGNIVYANEMAYKSHGYSKKEIMSMNIKQLLLPSEAELIKSVAQELRLKGKFSFKSTHVRKDGSTISAEISSQIIESGSERFNLAIVRDITERQQAEIKLRDAETRYRSLFEQSPDSIMIIEPETTKIIELNDAACKMLGYSREEFAKMKIADFDFLEAPELTEKRTAEIKLLGHAEFATKHRTKQGEIKDIIIVAKPIDISGKIFNLCIHRDITESKRLENELKLRVQMLDSATDLITLIDADANIVYANEIACKSLGYDRDELTKMNISQIIPEKDAKSIEPLIKETLERGKAEFETVYQRKDGSVFPLEIHARTIESGGERLFLAISRDITSRKIVEDELKLRAQLLDNATDSIFLRDLEGKYIYVNETALKALGYTKKEFLNLKVDQIVAPGNPSIQETLLKELMAKGTVTLETADLRKDGSIRPVESHARLIEAGGQKLILSTVRDITERKKLEETIRLLAHYDPLTGLPNRNLLDDRVTLALAHAARYGNGLALMMMDLDRFKEINDRLGHDAGDKLLKDVASKLVSVVRKTDTVSRMGGDEFLLLLSEVTREKDVTNIAEKIVEAIRKPFSYNGHELTITTSIGIAFYPNDGKDLNTLTKHADLAMYRVKDKGRNGYLRYNPKMNGKSPN